MPTDQIDSFRVICEGGLNTNESTLVLSQDRPGSASALVNYESAISGGYRRINGYTKIDEDFAEVGIDNDAEGRILWTGFFHNTGTGVNELYAVRPDAGGATYSFYKYDAALGWQLVTLPATRNMTGTYSEVVKLRHAEFNFGSGNHIMFVDGVNPLLWYNGSTWVELTSTATGGPSDPGGDQLIDAPSLIAVFKSHIFVGGDKTPTGQARYVHSAPVQPDTWTAAAGAAQMFPGFDVVQMKPFRDELYIFGQSAIKKAVPPSSADADFAQQDVTSELGCLAADSVLEIGGNLIFLSQDGIRPVAGTDKINDVELGLLSQDIQPIMDNLLDFGTLETLNGVVIRRKTQFRYTWGGETTTQAESKGLIGCVRTNSRIGRAWEFGQLLGIRSSCMWSGLVNGREVVLHGDYNGVVYQQEVGSDFDGAEIFSTYSTPFLDIGDTNIRKLLREIQIFVNAESSTTLFLGVSFDWDRDARILTPSDYTALISGGESYYDALTSIYDDSATLYGGEVRGMVETNLQGSCFSARFTFVNNSTDLPFTIQGLIPSYSVKGRN